MPKSDRPSGAQAARHGGSALQPAADPVMIGNRVPMPATVEALGVGTLIDLVLLLVEEFGAAGR